MKTGSDKTSARAVEATGTADGPEPAFAFLKPWHRALLVAAGVALAALVALRTNDGAHPDEFAHLDAFQYFETAWWPPDLGSDEVVYSAFGWSRVYAGELVYFAYGKVGALVRLVWEPEGAPYVLYRLLNVLLFAATLWALFFVRCRRIDPTIIGVAFLCLPQVPYLYGYANSDAWGVSLSVFVFVLCARMIDREVRTWTWRDVLLLGGLIGLVLVSKIPYALSLVLPFGMLFLRLVPAMRAGEVSPFRWFGRRLAVLGLTAAFVAAPLKVVYPMTQGGSDFDLRVYHMQDEKAMPGFKPSKPDHATLLLSQKGVGYTDMLAHQPWAEQSLQSFYGTYGYFAVFSPTWNYRIAAGCGLLLASLTLCAALLFWRRIDGPTRVCLLLTPPVVALNVAGSLYFSLNIAAQAQGRYLFPSLTAVALVAFGTWRHEGAAFRMVRLFVLFLLWGLCVYGIVAIAATDGYGLGMGSGSPPPDPH